MRPNWQEYFMEITQVTAKRSTCMRRQVGAIVVKSNNILATGYNGAPEGIKHCDETGCMREELKIPSGERAEMCRGLHAEQNALLQAARHGVNIDGADIYTTNSPCSICTKMIINAGIKRVFYIHRYADDMSLEMLAEARISLIQMGGTHASNSAVSRDYATHAIRLGYETHRTRWEGLLQVGRQDN